MHVEKRQRVASDDPRTTSHGSVSSEEEGRSLSLILLDDLCAGNGGISSSRSLPTIVASDFMGVRSWDFFLSLQNLQIIDRN